MRALAMGDLHLREHSPYDREPGDRLREQADVLAQIVRLAVERDVDVVLNAGDVLDGPTVTPAEERAFADFISALHEAGIPLVSITGNGKHDLAARDTHALTIFKYLPGHVVHDRPGITMVGDTAICALPWAPVTRLVAAQGGGDRDLTNEDAAEHLLNVAGDLLTHAALDVRERRSVLLLHWSIEGAAYPTGLPVDMAREPILPLAPLQELGFDAIIASHIHKPQLLSADPPILYTGSPLPINFGEAGVDHGCWIVDLVEGGAEFVPLDSRPLVTHDFDLTVRAHLNEDYDMPGPDMAGAIVRVRYRATEEQARYFDRAGIARTLYEAGAYNVLPVEVEIVREQRARVAQIDEQLAPIEALDLWMDAQDVHEDRRAALVELTDSYLDVIA